MPVCGSCNALYSGGNGVDCPACGADARIEEPNATERMDWGLILGSGLILVPVSSALGVQAWTFGLFWIWSQSLLADFLFVVGTVGAHVVAIAAANRVQHRVGGLFVAFGAGWLLHWIVYGASWLAVQSATEEDFGGSFGFVASVGYFGLTAAALAATGMYAYLRREA